MLKCVLKFFNLKMYVKIVKIEKLVENKNVINMLDNNLQLWIYIVDLVMWINQKLFSYWYLLVMVVMSYSMERVVFVRIWS